MGTQLFERGLLEQETGVLADRWGQPGSVPVNLTGTGGSETLHTVTAGKTLYISTITVMRSDAVAVAEYKDGGAGGTKKIDINALQDTTATVVLAVPLKFETDVYAGNGASVKTAMSGWEE